MVGVCALALAGTAKAALVHDSFSPTYRSPTGAVPTGSTVRLRLRVKPVIVVLNKASQPAMVDVPVRGVYRNGTTLSDQKSSFQAQVSGGKIRVPLFARDGVILVGTS